MWRIAVAVSVLVIVAVGISGAPTVRTAGLSATRQGLPRQHASTVTAARNLTSQSVDGVGQVRASATACKDVLFIGARGTGETASDHSGYGGDVYDVLKQIEGDTSGQRTFQAVPVDYNSTSVRTLLTNHDAYFQNIGTGVDWTVNYLTQQAKNCPDQQIVLAGFSQGAMVMHRVILQLAGTANGSQILSRLIDAILIGDGDQVPNDNQVRFGSAADNARGVGQAYRNISGTSTAKFPASVGSQVLSVCNRHDIVCGWTDNNITTCLAAPWICPFSVATMIRIHLSYDGSKPLLQAAKRAATDLLALRYTGGTLNINGTVGTALSATATVTGGILPINFSGGIDGDVPPAWLGSSQSGRSVTLSGTPTAAGSWIFDIDAQDKNNTVTIPVNLTVIPMGSWTGIKAPVPANANSNNAHVNVRAVSCPSSSECVAVGYYTDNSGGGQGLLWTLSGGSWTDAQAPVPADAVSAPYGVELLGVSCPSTSHCVAVGTYLNPSGYQGLVLTWSGGAWVPTVAPLPAGTFSDPGEVLDAVSCPSSSQCVATGRYQDVSNYMQGLLLTLSGGTWSAAEAPQPDNSNGYGEYGTEVFGVSCPTASDCVAVGLYPTSFTTGGPLLLTLSGGSWVATQAPLPSNANYNGGYPGAVSCPTASDCFAVGLYNTNPSNSGAAMLLTLSSGVWTARPSSGGIAGISCPSVSLCVTARVSVLSSGSWQTVQAALPTGGVNFNELGVSCSADLHCAAVGGYTDYLGDQGLLLTGPG